MCDIAQSPHAAATSCALQSKSAHKGAPARGGSGVRGANEARPGPPPWLSLGAKADTPGFQDSSPRHSADIPKASYERLDFPARWSAPSASNLPLEPTNVEALHLPSKTSKSASNSG
ncbi:hypothetical protein C8R44DRAFT_747742 [Mycena epipterygia]|nr:hypothetical protein C8R44DRAFT_747742 [Mycena epipterygia]